MMELSREIVAYTAGLFDGEGCILINRRRYSSDNPTYAGRPQYNLQVVIANTDRDIAEWLQTTFGGGFPVIFIKIGIIDLAGSGLLIVSKPRSS